MDDAKNPLDLRVTAAKSLMNLATVASEEMQSSLGLQEGVQSRFVDYTQLVWQAVLEKGLAPSQPVEIRRACLHAFARITTEMLDISVIPEKNYPAIRSDDAAVVLQEENKLNGYYHRLAEVFGTFQKHAGPMAAAVRDPDSEVRQTAISILSDLAIVRQRLKSLASGETAPTPPVGLRQQGRRRRTANISNLKRRASSARP